MFYFLATSALDILAVIFIGVLMLAAIVIMVISFLVYRVLRVSTKLRASQFDDYNTLAEKGDIVFIGDSLTDFYNFNEFFHNVSIYNRGIASDTTLGVLDRLKTNVIDIEPSKVFLQIGTNDYSSKKEKINLYIYNNIIKILELLKDTLPNTKFYLMSLYPVNRKTRFYSWALVGKRRNKNIIKLNDELEAYSKENNITYIDVYNHLIDDYGNLKSDYTLEGLHISFRGYKQITKVLKPYVFE